MKTIIMDSGEGGYDFIKKMKKTMNIQIQFLKISYKGKIISEYNKEEVRKYLLHKINISKKNSRFIIIACHSASSCILDILIKNNFVINNINIFEPILPMCFYIKEKKYKNILVLSTSLTEKIRWHYRLLNSNNIKVKYITFPLLPKIIENKGKDFNKSFNRLINKKQFLKICDCVVLGCTHFNVIKSIISKELKTKYNFNGVVLDSNEILLNFFNKSAFQKCKIN